MTCRPYCNGQYDMHPKARAVLDAHGRDRPAPCAGTFVNGAQRKRHLWRRVDHSVGMLYSTRHRHMWKGWKCVTYDIETGVYVRDYCPKCARALKGACTD